MSTASVQAHLYRFHMLQPPANAGPRWHIVTRVSCLCGTIDRDLPTHCRLFDRFCELATPSRPGTRKLPFGYSASHTTAQIWESRLDNYKLRRICLQVAESPRAENPGTVVPTSNRPHHSSHHSPGQQPTAIYRGPIGVLCTATKYRCHRLQ